MNETTDSPTTGTQEGPRVSHEQMRDVLRLRRSRADRKLAGVAGGLGRHFDIDPTIVRIGLVVLTFFGGAGIVIYGAAWLLVPEDGQDRAALDVSADTRKVLLIGALVVGACLVLGDAWGGFGGGWGLGILAVVAAVFLLNRDKNRHDGTTATYAAPTDGATEQTTPYGEPPASNPTTAWEPRAPRPRKAGLILFWPTLALLAIGFGTLGIIEASGTNLPDGAYPGLGVAIVGAMLVLGAWFGRAGGLPFLGVVLVFALSVTSMVGNDLDQGERLSYHPTSAAAVKDSYHTSSGEIVVNLTEVADPQALDGREIDVSVNAGVIEVVVPHGIDVNVDAELSFAGEVNVFDADTPIGDRRHGGLNPSVETAIDGGVGVPTLDLDIDGRVGQITVRQR